MSSSTKRTLVLLAIVLVLGLVRGALGWREAQAPTKLANPLAQLDRSAVDRVVIARGTERVELQRSEGAWRVQSLDDAADSPRIESALADLTGAGVTRVAAEDTSRLQAFFLDPDQALQVQLLKGAEVLGSFSLGAKDARSTYYLEQGGSRVLELDRSVGALSPTAASWRSRSIMPIDVGSVSEIEVRSKQGYTLRNTGSVFQLVRGRETREVPSEKAQAFLTTVANLTATGFLKPEEAKGLDTPALTLIVRGSSQEVELKVGAKNDAGDYAVKTNKRTVVFTLGALDVKGLQEPDLEADAPASSTPSAAPVPATAPSSAR